MSQVDARLQEMQFLARLDRDGPVEVGGPYDGSFERQMIISLIERGHVNGIDSKGVNLPTSYRLTESMLSHREETLWRLLDVKPELATKIQLRISHQGRLRLSDLQQQLKTGRDRDETGLLWAKRHLVTDIAVAVLAASADLPLSLMFLDMNGLKAINDSHGHAAGDAAIRSFFQAVTFVLGKRGEAYRNGGDEVVVVLPGVAGDHVSELVDAFVRHLRNDTVALGEIGATTVLTASCGSASTTDPKEGAEALLERADKAQYRAKVVSKKHSPRVSAFAVCDGSVFTYLPGGRVVAVES